MHTCVCVILNFIQEIPKTLSMMNKPELEFLNKNIKIMEIMNDVEDEITKNSRTHHENNEYEKLEYCVWKMTEKEDNFHFK